MSEPDAVTAVCDRADSYNRSGDAGLLDEVRAAATGTDAESDRSP